MAKKVDRIGLKSIYVEDAQPIKNNEVGKSKKVEEKNIEKKQTTSSVNAPQKTNATVSGYYEEEKRHDEIKKQQYRAILQEFEKEFVNWPNFDEAKDLIENNVAANKQQYGYMANEDLAEIEKGEMGLGTINGIKEAVANNITGLKSTYNYICESGVFTDSSDEIDKMYGILTSGSYKAEFERLGLGGEFSCAYEKFINYYNERERLIGLFEEYRVGVIEMEKLMAHVDEVVQKVYFQDRDKEYSR